VALFELQNRVVPLSPEPARVPPPETPSVLREMHAPFLGWV